MLREVVIIDDELCDGCGLCVPACDEGAIQIVKGKARLVAERLCDGLGACLGHCPRGAIRMEQREADEFDEAAVATHLRAAAPTSAGGCPGSRVATFNSTGDTPTRPAKPEPRAHNSELRSWPVQLRLLPPTAPALRSASLLVAADCVPVAYAGFHQKLLRGRVVVVACPKLDAPEGYVEKLAKIIRGSNLREITVAHMEVPCCNGILRMVLDARRLAGGSVPVQDVLIGVRGELLSRTAIPADCETETQGKPTCCPFGAAKGVD